ncbi:hypothetical protein B0T10DRAFT_466250 [Thelonectria olida]|uniref:Uncharacterized protein n=1 Tax=Thelonectria olida TaxID=1576542 RepID=A0A9P8VS98_9HYPO|nr:hypothetical protein B0T10DRAFT_466250 [Thelonectria olida]
MQSFQDVRRCYTPGEFQYRALDTIHDCFCFWKLSNYLLTRRTGPEPTPSEIDSALWTALQNEDTKTMSAILQTSNGILDETTMMAMACFSGSTEFAQLLLENGADINMDLKGFAPLDIASSQGHEELVKLLKDNRVDDSVRGQSVKMAD